MTPEIIPGILSDNIDEYKHRLNLVEASPAKWLHIDIMDGQFVPTISVMPHEIMELTTSLQLEAHMMTFRPERYFADLTVAGVTRILLHREAYDSLEECAHALLQANDYFPEVGIVYNPDTSLEGLVELPLNVVQCMGVVPGASGQPYLSQTDIHLQEIHTKFPDMVLAVDGGVHEENISHLQHLGVSRFIVTSRLFTGEAFSTNFEHFIQLVKGEK